MMQVEEPTLFDASALFVPSGEGGGAASLSPDRRRTVRQGELLHRGIHPLQPIAQRTLKLHAEAAPVDNHKAPGRRCGNCIFRVGSGWGDTAGHYPKCWFGWVEGSGASPPLYTRSAASDVRAWWPACTNHKWVH